MSRCTHAARQKNERNCLLTEQQASKLKLSYQLWLWFLRSRLFLFSRDAKTKIFPPFAYHFRTKIPRRSPPQRRLGVSSAAASLSRRLSPLSQGAQENKSHACCSAASSKMIVRNYYILKLPGRPLCHGAEAKNAEGKNRMLCFSFAGVTTVDLYS